MRLHNELLKRTKADGFTLTELLVAASIGVLLSVVAGEALVSHLQSNARLESLERLRNDWNRASHFIESEVALSERVLTSPGSVNLDQCSPSITADEFRFALEIRRDLPPVIYFVRDNEVNSSSIWNGSASLYRCGPSIAEDGDYANQITGTESSLGVSKLVLDGLAEDCDLSVIPDPSNTTNTSKSLRINLCIKGISTQTFEGETNTYSRISPIFSYPNATSLCSDQNLTIEGFYKLSGGDSSANTLSVPQGEVPEDQDVLICGYGGGDNIEGSTGNDVLEAGDLTGNSHPGATLNGLDGNDRLVGGKGADALNGNAGDDVLIGQDGNDTLTGGTGENRYLPGLGNDSIVGGPDLDVVFLDDVRNNFSGLSACTRSNCSLSYSNAGTAYTLTTTNAEVLIFRDGRYDLK
ncbi:prepilin-type N-terminal cleavage/methylation domain-containing protein [Synechococcus sp. LTW-G]